MSTLIAFLAFLLRSSSGLRAVDLNQNSLRLNDAVKQYKAALVDLLEAEIYVDLVGCR